MDDGSSRRRLLAAIGATSATMAGCLDVVSDAVSGGEDGGTGATDGGGGAGGASKWPAIEAGELLADFENLDDWYPRTGEVSAASEAARTGSQAALIESDSGTAGISTTFSEAIDLESWDVSMAVKPESVDRVIVEFLAPGRSERITSVRLVPGDHDGWLRVDCGYEHKPADEPDLSDVTGVNIVADGPSDGPTRMLVDDLRRTESADNGKAILACYEGHDSHYEIAAEMLAERDWTAAVPVNPNEIGDEGRMGLEELRTLQERGWDVCSYPTMDGPLPERPADRQQRVIETGKTQLEEQGFSDGARHFFAPDDRMNAATLDAVRDLHETGFLFGGCTSGVPPTGMHTIPLIWGPALFNGVRRHINLASQYNLLTVLRIPRIVEESDVDENENRMALEDFEHLLDHIEDRGLDVITPSDLVDGSW